MTKYPTNAAELFRNHSNKQKAYGVVKKALELLKYTQQHRGINMAILDGDQFFRELLPSITKKIEALIQDIDLLLITHNLKMASDPFLQLKNEWKLVNNHWDSLEVLQNFEVHNHFVKRLMKFIRTVINNQESAKFSQSSVDQDNTKITEFIFHDFIDLIESLAQIRGLSSHIASSENSNQSLSQLLHLLINTSYEKLAQTKQKLANDNSPEAESVLVHIGRNLCYQRAENYLEIIPKMVTDDTPRLAKSQRCFSLGTEVLNSYMEVLHISLNILSQSISPQLQAWIHNSNKQKASYETSAIIQE